MNEKLRPGIRAFPRRWNCVCITVISCIICIVKATRPGNAARIVCRVSCVIIIVFDNRKMSSDNFRSFFPGFRLRLIPLTVLIRTFDVAHSFVSLASATETWATFFVPVMPFLANPFAMLGIFSIPGKGARARVAYAKKSLELFFREPARYPRRLLQSVCLL